MGSYKGAQATVATLGMATHITHTCNQACGQALAGT